MNPYFFALYSDLSGHKGTGSEADKKMSCNSTKVVYPFNTYKEQQFELSQKEADKVRQLIKQQEEKLS